MTDGVKFSDATVRSLASAGRCEDVDVL